MYLFFPQWQGSGERDEVYHGAHRLRESLPATLNFVEVPVKPLHSITLENDIWGYTTLLEQLESACTILKGLDPSHIFLVGGDCSGEIAPVSFLNQHYQGDLAVVWFDAHADMNTPDSTPSGNVHGMPLACAIGLGPAELTGIGCHVPMVDPENVAIVGLRSVDDIEKYNVRGAGVHPFTMRDIDERGMRTVIQQAIHAVSSGTSGFHLSFDLDAVDPAEAPGVGTPVHGGITYREAHLAMETICDSGLMTSLELVELNPVLDIANRTAILGVELIMSALGKRIL